MEVDRRHQKGRRETGEKAEGKGRLLPLLLCTSQDMRAVYIHATPPSSPSILAHHTPRFCKG